MIREGSKIRDSRLFSILNCLEKDEFKELGDFVHSPFHNKNTRVMQLYEALYKYYPNLDTPKLNREALHAKVFRGQEFKDIDIRRVMSQFYQVVEGYLGWKEMTKQPAILKVAQMKAFRERGLQKHFDKCSREANGILDKELKDLNHYYLQFEVEQERESFEEQYGGRRSETHLQEVSDKLDIFYMASKLKQSCTVFSYEAVFKHKYDIHLTDEVLDLLERKDIKAPLVNLYRFGLLTMTQPENEEHYNQLKAILSQDLKLDPREERNIHVLGQNYCIRKVNQGKAEYFTELFYLYKLGLEKEVIQSDMSQFPPAFKNIVSTGLRVREYDWVEKFINDYADLMGLENRADYKNYNLARLRFDQGRFKEAKQLLQDVEFKDLFVTLNARVLLIKTYYELDQWELLEHQLKAFEHYVARRQKTLSYHANIFKNTVRYIWRLVKLDFNKPKEVEKLVTKIKAEKSLVEKQWLLEKVGA